AVRGRLSAGGRDGPPLARRDDGRRRDRAAGSKRGRCRQRRPPVTGLIVTLFVVAVIFAGVVALVLTRFLYICQPNEVLVFSGGARASAGRKVGYRILKGGRAVRIPMLETVDSMDLTNMPIEVAVQGAYSKGGITGDGT